VGEESPDLLIVDMQMGNMGGMAVCLELRLQESYDALDHVSVLMLLDRRPDVFLARRSDAEAGWSSHWTHSASGAPSRRCSRAAPSQTTRSRPYPCWWAADPAAGGTRVATLTPAPPCRTDHDDCGAAPSAPTGPEGGAPEPVARG